MKKQTLFRFAVSVLFLFFVRLPASAQSQEYLMTFQVPFDFQVGEKLLPAGKYVIKREPQMPNFLLIQDAKRKISVIVSTLPHNLSKEPTQGSLTFKEYGGERFLSVVKIRGHEEGYALIKSKAESRLAQIAKAKTFQAIPNGATTNN